MISVTERDYVKAAKVSGVSTGNIILKYIIPNAAGVLITNGAFYLADTLLASSGLSFLGIGYNHQFQNGDPYYLPVWNI